MVVIPVTLKGANYLHWARLAKTALGGRGLWEIVEEGRPQEKTILGEDGKEVVVADAGAKKKGQEDLLVLSILQHSLDPSLQEGYSYCETSKELWDTLQKVYGNKSNLSRVFEVKRAINTLSQEDTDFDKHFGKFRSLWAELEMLRPATTNPDVLNQRREQDKVFALLLTLHPSYGDLIKHILRNKELPSLDEVCSEIQKEQGSVGLFGGGKKDLVLANQADGTANKSSYKPGDKKVWVCDHCKKKGHGKDKCWILHPHLKPQKFKTGYNDGKANFSGDIGEPSTHSTMRQTRMEHHRAVLIPCTLKGPGNYITWSRMTRAALGGRGLWEHVTSSSAPKQITQGEDGKEIVVIDEGKWVQEDLMVLSILHSSLDGPLMDTYSHCTTPKQLWDTLQRVYGNTSNLTRIYEVKRAINTLQQEEGDFTKHLGKYSQLWSELELLRPHTTDPATLLTRREEDKVFGLLLTLNPSYGSLVKHILRADKLPDLDEVCAQIQKEEGSVGLFGSKGDLTMAHQAEEAVANKAAYKQNEKKVLCDHCKKQGHKKSQCWILHPHLKPAKFNKEARAHLGEVNGGHDGSLIYSLHLNTFMSTLPLKLDHVEQVKLGSHEAIPH
ncbi:hypothetical protein Bca101_067689 [Brassica carinata]